MLTRRSQQPAYLFAREDIGEEGRFFDRRPAVIGHEAVGVAAATIETQLSNDTEFETDGNGFTSVNATYPFLQQRLQGDLRALRGTLLGEASEATQRELAAAVGITESTLELQEAFNILGKFRHGDRRHQGTGSATCRRRSVEMRT